MQEREQRGRGKGKRRRKREEKGKEKEQKEDLPPSVESSYAIWPVQHDTKSLSMKKTG